MRLWHYELLPILPWRQLLGQHRECVALRGRGWGRKHKTVNYVFTHPYEYLYRYHIAVLKEMELRGYEPKLIWYDNRYRGRRLGFDLSPFTDLEPLDPLVRYPEHNHQYLLECLENLKWKGITFPVDIPFLTIV